MYTYYMYMSIILCSLGTFTLTCRQTDRPTDGQTDCILSFLELIQVGKKYGESFPLEIAIRAFLGKLKYEPDNNIGLHVREYGVDSYFKGCEAAGEDYNPLKTSHGNIWDHPKKR